MSEFLLSEKILYSPKKGLERSTIFKFSTENVATKESIELRISWIADFEYRIRFLIRLQTVPWIWFFSFERVQSEFTENV